MLTRYPKACSHGPNQKASDQKQQPDGGVRRAKALPLLRSAAPWKFGGVRQHFTACTAAAAIAASFASDGCRIFRRRCRTAASAIAASFARDGCLIFRRRRRTAAAAIAAAFRGRVRHLCVCVAPFTALLWRRILQV